MLTLPSRLSLSSQPQETIASGNHQLLTFDREIHCIRLWTNSIWLWHTVAQSHPDSTDSSLVDSCAGHRARTLSVPKKTHTTEKYYRANGKLPCGRINGAARNPDFSEGHERNTSPASENQRRPLRGSGTHTPQSLGYGSPQ